MGPISSGEGDCSKREGLEDAVLLALRLRKTLQAKRYKPAPEAGEGKDMALKECSPADTSIQTQCDPFQILNFQNCKINWFYFKPLHLYSFVIATIVN